VLSRTGQLVEEPNPPSKAASSEVVYETLAAERRGVVT